MNRREFFGVISAAITATAVPPSPVAMDEYERFLFGIEWWSHSVVSREALVRDWCKYENMWAEINVLNAVARMESQ